MGSVARFSVITPISRPTPVRSTPSGPTRIMFRAWCGGTVSSSCRQRFTSRTSSQAAGISETRFEELLTKGQPRVALLALACKVGDYGNDDKDTALWDKQGSRARAGASIWTGAK